LGLPARVKLLHPPAPAPAGLRLVPELGRTITMMTGISVEASQLDDPQVEPGENAYILTIARGPLYRNGLKAALRVGAHARGPIPYWVTALWLRERARDCRRPGLAYRPGPLDPDETYDLLMISQALADITGKKTAVLQDPAMAEGHDCIIPLTVVPDHRLIDPYRTAGPRIVEASLLGDRPDLVITWILSSLLPT